MKILCPERNYFSYNECSGQMIFVNSSSTKKGEFKLVIACFLFFRTSLVDSAWLKVSIYIAGNWRIETVR
jgi:hypothetical protein